MKKLATRRLDELHRLVIPPNGPEGWRGGTFLNIYMDGQDRLILEECQEQQVCILCGDHKDLLDGNGHPVCRLCAKSLLEQIVADEEARG